jgi:hypothetical protein
VSGDSAIFLAVRPTTHPPVVGVVLSEWPIGALVVLFGVDPGGGLSWALARALLVDNR